MGTLENIIRLLMGGGQDLAADAIRVGSAIGGALAEAGCRIEGRTADENGDQTIRAVSPAGMEFTVKLTAIGVRCVCGVNHDAE